MRRGTDCDGALAVDDGAAARPDGADGVFAQVGHPWFGGRGDQGAAILVATMGENAVNFPMIVDVSLRVVPAVPSCPTGCVGDGGTVSGDAQEGFEDGIEPLRIVGVDPVAGVLDGDEAGGGEQSADAGPVLRQDVVGVGAGDEQGGAGVGYAGLGLPAFNSRKTGCDLREARAPGGAGGLGIVQAQVLQQEIADGGVWLGDGQGFVGFLAGQAGVQGNGAHGGQDGGVAGRVLHRGDVADQQAGDGMWVGQGEFHGDLAAHGMAHHGSGQGVAVLQGVQHVPRHGGVVHRGGVRAGAVVAQIHGKHQVAGGQGTGDSSEVAGHAEQTVQQDQGGAGAEFAGIEKHGRNMPAPGWFIHGGWRISRAC